MKMTLLDMTQNILSALDSDEVNSIGDTVEAMQVATVIQESYDELFSSLTIPSKQALLTLESLVDVTKPNYLKIPDTVKQIEWIKYDYQTNGLVDYVGVTEVEIEQFLDICLQQNAQSSANTIVQDFSGARMHIVTNKNPQFWTTFDNEHIVFDSYDNSLDSVLQANKSLTWGQLNNTFVMEDTFVPMLDDDLFPMLLAEAKSVCFVNIKQVSSAKEEQRSKRQLMRTQNDRWRADQRRPYNRQPDYGRRRV